MREKTLRYLAYVTGPAVVLAAGLSFLGGGTSSATEQAGGAKLLPGLTGHTDALASLSITGPDGTLTLTRTPVAGKPAEGWSLRDKGGYPVPPLTIRPIIDGLIALHGVAPKTSREKLYSRLDLNQPGKDSQAHLLALADTKGESLGSIVLGRTKPATGVGGTDKIYARVPGDAGTWLAEPSISLPGETLDWINRSIIDIDADKVREVVVTLPGTAPLDFFRDKAADKLAIRNLPAGTKLKSETPGSDIEMAFQTLDLTDVKPANKLGGSTAGSVHLVTFNGITADFALTKDAGQTWAVVTATGTGDGVKPAQDISARTKGWAYEIPSDKATTLTVKLSDLVDAAKK
jgi:hypothetical protein